ncbi:MAG: hypothetical protein V4607_02150 [Pseudomonadota bacterium]
MSEIKTDITIGAVKITPPAVAFTSGLTSDQIIAALTITYLVVLITHSIWKWLREARSPYKNEP